MRRNHHTVPILALVCALFAVLAAPAAAQKPDLVVESAGEPPDNAVADNNDFLVSFTVGNQGRRRAGRVTLARAYLSLGRVMSADDRRRRVGSRRVRPLRAGRSQTRRLVAEIPPAFQRGEYFLIICADVRNVVDEVNDRANCHVSGQKIQIIGPGDEPRRGPAGPPGPQGEPGPPGPAGSGGGNTVVFPRKVLPLGTATFTGAFGIGDNEGSTQMFDLGEVGGVRIRALCRKTTNGDDANADVTPTNPANEGSRGGYDEDGDEAKILLYYDRPDGTFSFRGDHGSRRNVSAGFGRNEDTENSDEDVAAGETGGEGRHQFLATSRDPEGSRLGGLRPSNDYGTAYRSAGGFVSTSAGADFHLSMFAGVDVLGVGEESCVFGGTATVISSG